MAELNDHSTRQHALLSASSSARWLACPPSAVAAEAYPNEPTEYTLEGTQAHEIAEQILKGNPIPNDTPAEAVECARAYKEYIDGLITSPDAMILVEQRVDFSPWVPEGFGTCDCIIIQDSTLIVVDYKYGRGVPVSAVNNAQLKLYALGALNDFGFMVDVEKVETHIFQPRIDNISSDSMTAAELMDWAENTVKPTADKAFKGEGEYAAGEHCRFCPHAGKCVKLTETNMDTVKANLPRHGDCSDTSNLAHDKVYLSSSAGLFEMDRVLSPDKIAEVLKMEYIITMWLKRVKEQAFKDMMEGVKIPGYKLVEGKQGNRKWTEETKVIDKLLSEGHELGSFTETSVISPTQLEKKLGKKKFDELVSEFVERAPGSPTIAQESDSKPEYSPYKQACIDFLS